MMKRFKGGGQFVPSLRLRQQRGCVQFVLTLLVMSDKGSGQFALLLFGDWKAETSLLQ